MGLPPLLLVYLVNSLLRAQLLTSVPYGVILLLPSGASVHISSQSSILSFESKGSLLVKIHLFFLFNVGLSFLD